MRHVEHPPHEAFDSRDGRRRDDARDGARRDAAATPPSTRHADAPPRGVDDPLADGTTVALAALGQGVIARVESVGGGSLAPLLERLGIRPGSVVRCQTCASSTIVLLVGSRLVPIPRAWAHAVLVTPFEAPALADHLGGHQRSHVRGGVAGSSSRSPIPPPGPGPSISSDERSFATDASSRMLG